MAVYESEQAIYGEFDPMADDEPEVEPYWAELPAEELIEHLHDQERRYFEAVAQQGFGQAWLEAYCAYYGLSSDGLTWETQSIGLDGEEGELLRFRVNEFRSYVRQMSAMASGQRPSFQALATNTDYATLAQIETSDQAVNHVYWSKYGERKERKTIEKGDLFGIGFTWVSFDPDGGEDVEVPATFEDGSPAVNADGSPIMQQVPSGDLLIRSLAPWEQVCDPYLDEVDDHLWRLARPKRSKWELAAEYPEHREAILALSAASDDIAPMAVYFGIDLNAASDDEVVVRHWYHVKSRALPEGRYVVYAGDIVLYDGPMPFRRLPFADYCPAEYMGTSFGYTDAWDLIPLGQMLDQVVSDIATNLSAFGRQSIYTEEGVDFDVQDLSDGLSVLTGQPGQTPPVALNLAAMPEAARFMLGYLEQRFQSISGLNSVARGQTSDKVTSGTMAALFHSIALEVNSGRQAAVDAHRERVANLILEILQDFLEHPWMLEIAGHDERGYLRAVNKQTFSGIRRVTVKTGNPMMRTQAGRLEIAKVLLEAGSVKDPQQLIELIVSGQLKPLYQAPRSMKLRIRWENEQLSGGQVKVVQKQDPDDPWQLDPQMPYLPDGSPNVVLGPDGQPVANLYDTVPSVPVLPMDHPAEHIYEHTADLSRAVEQGNEPAKRAVLAHIYEHVRAWKSADPALAQLLGHPPPPQQPGAMLPEGAGGRETAETAPEENIDGQLPGLQERDSTGVKLPKAAQPPAQYQGEQIG